MPLEPNAIDVGAKGPDLQRDHPLLALLPMCKPPALPLRILDRAIGCAHSAIIIVIRFEMIAIGVGAVRKNRRIDWLVIVALFLLLIL